MKKFWKENSLSIVFLLLFIIAIIGQYITGYHVYLNELADAEGELISLSQYISSGHFMQATFENWESEFLQMALFVLLTISLRQVGSSESKRPGKKEKVERKPNPNKHDVPWPVKQGGIVLKIYENSLTIAFFILFILSWVLHFYGSIRNENLFRQLKNEPLIRVSDYVMESRFWFESLQNWQSEFFSVFALVILSISLRQRGSSQSKPVDAPDSETGE